MVASVKIETMELQGIVQEGTGNASFWLKKYADIYQLWTGMEIIPGSLNVLLPDKFDLNNSDIEPFKKIYSLTPYGGNRDIYLVPCEIYKEDANRIYGFAWGTANAAKDPDYKVLEIISSIKLRDALQLKDGAVVTIDIPLPWKS